MSELETVGHLLSHPAFLSGAALGSIALVAMYLVSQRGIRVRGWSLSFSGAVMVVLIVLFEASLAEMLAIGAVAGAGALIDLARRLEFGESARALHLLGLILVPVAVVAFTIAVGPSRRLLLASLPIVVLVVGASLARFQSHDAAGLSGPLLAVSMLGIWVTVPDTDMVSILVGVALTIGWATLRPIGARSLASGSFVIVAIIAWLSMMGAGRDLKWVIGSWACLAIFPVLWLLARLGIESVDPTRLLAFHVLYVIAATRVVDHVDSEVIGAGIIVALVAALFVSLYTQSRNIARPTSARASSRL